MPLGTNTNSIVDVGSVLYNSNSIVQIQMFLGYSQRKITFIKSKINNVVHFKITDQSVTLIKANYATYC